MTANVGTKGTNGTKNKNWKQKLKKPGIVFVWLLLWQLASVWLGHELLLVSPLRTLETLYGLVQQSDYWFSIGTSLFRIMLGFLLAFVFGALFAFLAWRVPFLYEFLAPMISVMKATPVASFIILALLWVGGANISTLCSFVMGMPIIYSNVYQGLKNIDQKLLEVGQIFQLSRKRQIEQIIIPSLKPYLMSAFMVGIGFCWKSGVAAEVIGLPNNTIGEHLYNAKVYLETPELFAWTVTIIVLSVSIEKLLVRLLQRLW